MCKCEDCDSLDIVVSGNTSKYYQCNNCNSTNIIIQEKD